MPKEEFPENPSRKDVDDLLRKEHGLGKDPDPGDEDVDKALTRLSKKMGENFELADSEMPDEVLIDEWAEKGYQYAGKFIEIREEDFTDRKIKIIGRGGYFLVFEWDEELFKKYNED